MILAETAAHMNFIISNVSKENHNKLADLKQNPCTTTNHPFNLQKIASYRDIFSIIESIMQKIPLTLKDTDGLKSGFLSNDKMTLSITKTLYQNMMHNGNGIYRMSMNCWSS